MFYNSVEDCHTIGWFSIPSVETSNTSIFFSVQCAPSESLKELEPIGIHWSWRTEEHLGVDVTSSGRCPCGHVSASHTRGRGRAVSGHEHWAFTMSKLGWKRSDCSQMLGMLNMLSLFETTGLWFENCSMMFCANYNSFDQITAIIIVFFLLTEHTWLVLDWKHSTGGVFVGYVVPVFCTVYLAHVLQLTHREWVGCWHPCVTNCLDLQGSCFTIHSILPNIGTTRLLPMVEQAIASCWMQTGMQFPADWQPLSWSQNKMWLDLSHLRISKAQIIMNPWRFKVSYPI